MKIRFYLYPFARAIFHPSNCCQRSLSQLAKQLVARAIFPHPEMTINRLLRVIKYRCRIHSVLNDHTMLSVNWHIIAEGGTSDFMVLLLLFIIFYCLYYYKCCSPNEQVFYFYYYTLRENDKKKIVRRQLWTKTECKVPHHIKHIKMLRNFYT